MKPRNIAFLGVKDTLVRSEDAETCGPKLCRQWMDKQGGDIVQGDAQQLWTEALKHWRETWGDRPHDGFLSDIKMGDCDEIFLTDPGKTKGYDEQRRRLIEEIQSWSTSRRTHACRAALDKLFGTGVTGNVQSGDRMGSFLRKNRKQFYSANGDVPAMIRDIVKRQGVDVMLVSNGFRGELNIILTACDIIATSGLGYDIDSVHQYYSANAVSGFGMPAREFYEDLLEHAKKHIGTRRSPVERDSCVFVSANLASEIAPAAKAYDCKTIWLNQDGTQDNQTGYQPTTTVTALKDVPRAVDSVLEAM